MWQHRHSGVLGCGANQCNSFSGEKKHVTKRHEGFGYIQTSQITQLPGKRQKRENGLILEPGTWGESSFAAPGGAIGHTT